MQIPRLGGDVAATRIHVHPCLHSQSRGVLKARASGGMHSSFAECRALVAALRPDTLHLLEAVVLHGDSPTYCPAETGGSFW